MAKTDRTPDPKPEPFTRTKFDPDEYQTIEIRVRHADLIRDLHTAWPSRQTGRNHTAPRDWLEAILDSVMPEWNRGVPKHMAALMAEHKRVPTPAELRVAIEAART